MKKSVISKCLIVCMIIVVMLSGCSDIYDDDYEDYYYQDDCEDYYNDEDYYGCQYDEDYYDDEDYHGYQYDDDYYYDNDGYYEYDVPENINLSPSDYALGTCGEIEGTTIIVSIFLDDINSSWGSGDSTLISDCLDSVDIAAKWLSKSVAAYGRDATFIYDWNKYSDLCYQGAVNVDMVVVDDSADEIDFSAWQFIDETIDSKALIQKYGADNIAYLLFINTSKSNEATSCTRNYYEDMPYPYEMCYMYMFCDGEQETPSAIAHELLHTFGAPDLYRADTYGDNYGTTKELVRYLEESESNDIMFTTYDAKYQTPYYDKITNDFTDVDAYYVGLIDSCDFVDEWGLGASQH